MKKLIFCAAAALLLGFSASADDKPAIRKDHPRRMQPPVYASKNPVMQHRQGEPTAEQKAQFNAAHKRRFEIMVLIGAYKIMPENERQNLRAELLKRIEEDFQATMQMQKERIAHAEADLKKLRSELAEREANGKVLVERELDRLLKMPMPTRRRPANK